MNKKIKSLALFSILLCWATLVYAFSSSPPTSNTGAPGEGSCSNCHRGTNSPPGNVRITGLPQSYEAGRQYNLTVTVSETGKMRWGFQITALRDDGSAAGTFTVTDSSRTQLLNGSVGGRTRMYVQHTVNGTQRGTRDTASFNLSWTAPTSDVGRITFYAAGNAANGDSSSGGDNVYLTNVAISGAPATPAPTLSNINPNRGPSSGGTEVTLTGTNFSNGATVTFGGTRVTPRSVNATSITAVTPSGSAGAVNVVVTNSDGQTARINNGFTFEASQLPAPTLNSINPNTGPTSGDTTVTLSGTGFMQGATVSIGSRQATMVSVTSTQITAVTQPSDPGNVNVTVTNPDGQASVITNAFTYVGTTPSGSVQLLNPNGTEVLSSGGLPFMINWMVMSGSTATQRLELSTDGGQTFSTMITDNLSADKTSFVYNVPPAINTTRARIRISVIENGATISDMSDADFRILPAATITKITATVTSSIKFKVTGTNFQSGAILEIEGQAAPSTNVKSATSIVAKKVSSSFAGKAVKVRVRNPDGTVSMEMTVTP
ncbi:MAG: IPT/TIG domain-containing protein [Acidobacteria bacterium]|nr:IPT/TIG domain-containing protein [Acidobacteriota bacterium]